MTFILVHGGAHGAWCWERMSPHLVGAVVALDLPGRGSRPASLEAITVDDWVDAVVEAISMIAADRVVLVGHSLAGMVLPRVAERVSEKLERMIFISCSVPSEGQAVIDILSPQIRPLAEQQRRNRVASVLPEETARSMFCNDMNPEQTRFVLDRLVPEAWTPILEPSRLAGLARGVPATYVKLLRDAVIPPALQDEMIAHLGTVEVAELDAGHDAMISAPEALAALINDLSGR
ncbi:MAG: alpha/beta fold hydrolase [Myxococcota bacterium]